MRVSTHTRDKDPQRVKGVPSQQGKPKWPRHGRSKARRNAARLASAALARLAHQPLGMAL